MLAGQPSPTDDAKLTTVSPKLRLLATGTRGLCVNTTPNQHVTGKGEPHSLLSS